MEDPVLVGLAAVVLPCAGLPVLAAASPEAVDCELPEPEPEPDPEPDPEPEPEPDPEPEPEPEPELESFTPAAVIV